MVITIKLNPIYFKSHYEEESFNLEKYKCILKKTQQIVHVNWNASYSRNQECVQNVKDFWGFLSLPFFQFIFSFKTDHIF